MLATDPLSLALLGCVVFAGVFIGMSALLGFGHGHPALGHPSPGHAIVTHGSAGHHGATVAAPAGHASVTTNTSGPPVHALGLRVALPGQSVAPVASVAAPSLARTALAGVNLNAALTFLFGFGLIGYALHNATRAGSLVSLTLAILAGLAAAAGINALYARLFGQESGRLERDSSRLEGRLGVVSLAIRPGGIGEVIFVGANGARQSVGARSAATTPIPRDADIVIIAMQGGVAVVQTWEAFLASAGGAPVLRDD